MNKYPLSMSLIINNKKQINEKEKPRYHFIKSFAKLSCARSFKSEGLYELIQENSEKQLQRRRWQKILCKEDKNQHKRSGLCREGLLYPPKSNFNNFSISGSCELNKGMCHLIEYDEHQNNHHKQIDAKVAFKKQVKPLILPSFIILGLSPLLKRIITLEKYYLSSLKSCQVKLNSICENNHLPAKLPDSTQLYRYREQLVAENYPEVKQFLSEVVKKTYDSLRSDEVFFIYSHIKNGEVSMLFNAKALLENLIKQQQLQPSFIHIDATYKLIDLGLPLRIISTENINHNYRLIVFFISWSESASQTTLMLKKLQKFLSTHFN